jgi:hypothetical protein
MTLPLPLSAPQLRKTDEAVIQEIDRLLDHHTEREIAAIHDCLRDALLLSVGTRSFPLRTRTLDTSIALFRLSRSLRAKTFPDPHPPFSDLEEVRASVMFGPASLHDG